MAESDASARRTAETVDQRSPYERDRDRILYTSAFRRLAETTQVTTAADGPRFHNRLTHTLEVAQITLRLAQYLVETYGREIGDQLDPVAAEAAALAHDLGHPPFGHRGEKALDRALVARMGPGGIGPADGYEGNAQSFRIVTKLASRVGDQRGLNLTRRTLNGLLKYPWTWEPGSRKYGCFLQEAELLAWVREGRPGREQSLEAQVMDHCDDIAYSVHDLYDFVVAGLIPLKELTTESDVFAEFARESAAKLEMDESEFDAAAQDVLVALPREADLNSFEARGRLRNYASKLIGSYVRQSFELDRERGSLRLAPRIRSQIRVLKQVTVYFVLESRALATQQMGQDRVIDNVVGVLWEDMQDGGRLAPTWASQLLDEGEPLHRVVADVVSGMTERQAIRFHRLVMGLEAGSILERPLA